MTEIAITEPLEIIAGDYIAWKKTLADYPAGTWTLVYTLINSTNKYSITATNSSGDHLVAVAAATSANYAAGDYQWQAVVTSGSEKYTIASGTITVKPSFAAATTLDVRSPAKRTLDAIDAEIEARANGGFTQEYTIGNRSLRKCTIPELITMRDKYAAMVKKEENAERIKNGLGSKNKLYVRF